MNNEVEDFSADLDGMASCYSLTFKNELTRKPVDDDSEEKVSAASVRTLPSAELDGIWDT